LKNRNSRADYSRLYRKLTLQILLIIVIAVAALIFFGLLARGWFGNWVSGLFESIFGVDDGTAVDIYHHMIRGNLEFIYIIIMGAFAFALSCYLPARFSKYLNEINRGVGLLADGSETEIELSSELEPMARKLNALKQTLEKRAQDARLAEQRKNDVVMYLAHDLKTPLTSVVGYLSLLSEAPDMPAEQRAKYTNIAFEKACRLEQLIDEFFEITRYNLQTIALSKQEIDLSYMLAQLADEFYPQFEKDGKRAILRVDEGLSVYGDPDKLARVFNNILKNAAAYGEAGSAVEITARLAAGAGAADCAKGKDAAGSDEEAGFVIAAFRNAGSVPEEKLAVIFEKFYRMDGARSSGGGGAGLGLAIAKEIVTLHGGRIYAESDAESTTFTVELPVAR
jgi:two-component system sensor histidine kinase VanS